MLIASEYYTNGFNKIEALLTAGYSDTYARNVGLKLFVNDRVLEAMRRLSAVAIVKTGYSIEQAQAEYEQARVQAIQQNQPSAAVSAITGKARLHGMDKDADHKLDTPKPLSQEELEKLRVMAAEITDDKLESKHHKIGVA